MSISVIHVGVGGRGRWPVQRIQQRDDFESAALVDVSENALATAREVTGLSQERCFHSMEEALEQVEADAVVVITPPPLHAQQCLKVVQAGKHLLVEKPFTLSLRDAWAVVEEADKQGVRVAVCQNARYGAESVTLARLVREEVYGPPSFGLMTKFSWRPGVHHSKGQHSYLWERGIHDLDQLRSIFGAEPVRVWGHSFNPSWSPYSHGAGSYAWLEFGNGATCGYMCTFAAHAGGSSLRIECAEGSLQPARDGIHVRRPGTDVDEIVPLDKVPAAEEYLLDAFARYIGEGIEPEFGGHQNLYTVGLVEAVGIASDEARVIDFADFVDQYVGGTI